MPQMAPLNWLSLFILFNIVFILFIVMNYYSFLYKPKMPEKIKKNLKLNWKW